MDTMNVTLLVELKKAYENGELKELNINNVQSLIGKRIQAICFGYNGQDYEDDFVVGEVITEYELAKRTTLSDGTIQADHWNKVLSQDRIEESKKNLEIITSDGRDTYINYLAYHNENGEFCCSDAYRKVYYKIVD